MRLATCTHVAVHAAVRGFARLWRAASLVLKHPRIPRWLGWLLGVCLLIPGPVDEVLAAPLVVTLLILRRDVLVDCWRQSVIHSAVAYDERMD